MSHAAIARQAVSAYQSSHVQSDDPIGLVVKLYDGLLGFIARAAEAIDSGSPHLASEPIRRASDIVAELQTVLDLEQGGEIAENLDRIYTYTRKRLVESHLKGDVEGLNEITRLFGPLRNAWSEARDRQTA